MSWLTLLLVGWVIRIPGLSRDEGHEAITRRAWEGLDLTAEQRRALIRGVRAPDASLRGLLVTALPFAQRRHALRAWSGTTTADGVREARAFLTAAHIRALGLAEGPRRWAAFGTVLHCLQDAYSPAHVDREGARIVRMKHWGPLDRMRPGDEHGFPSDARDSAWKDGELTDEAKAAADASRRYLEIVSAEPGSSLEAARREFTAFLDERLALVPNGT